MRIEITDHFLKRWGQRVRGKFTKDGTKKALEEGRIIKERKYFNARFYFENETRLKCEKRVLYAGYCWCIKKVNNKLIFTTIYPQWGKWED